MTPQFFELGVWGLFFHEECSTFVRSVSPQMCSQVDLVALCRPFCSLIQFRAWSLSHFQSRVIQSSRCFRWFFFRLGPGYRCSRPFLCVCVFFSPESCFSHRMSLQLAVWLYLRRSLHSSQLSTLLRLYKMLLFPMTLTNRHPGLRSPLTPRRQWASPDPAS